MPQGWIRAYAAEVAAHGFKDENHEERDARANFRASFTTKLVDGPSPTSNEIATLRWGDVVELPDGLADGAPMTAAIFDGVPGFVRTDHVVELAYVKRRGSSEKGLKARLDFATGSGHVELIWGDPVQIVEKGTDVSKVRARGFNGSMKNSDLTSDGLLEVYFIDVGQGDGVLVRTPDGRHLLIDGGLERGKQLTGKNAADFVDWKFFEDYGHHTIVLDSMTASHSDNDHYGGLEDLVRETKAADRELDCLGVAIETLHHPGLSRWENRPDADPPHADGLGPKVGDHFVRLLGGRQDAEAAIKNGATHELSRDWKSFIRAVLENDANTQVEPVSLPRTLLEGGGPLPEFWPAAAGCSIRVLAPVTEDVAGAPALRDLGDKGKNTNGHSVCLRIDFGKARILLTGDLNKKAMDHLRACYGDRLGAFECDVAKACHHGSDDISYRFLEAVKAGATVISSGDAEGHAHPRPEIVGASATTGHVSIDRTHDKLLTPLIYMTEVERSVSLGAVNRIDFAKLPAQGGGTLDGILPGRHLDELSKKQRISPAEQKLINKAPVADRPQRTQSLIDHLEALEDKATTPGDDKIQATYYYTVPKGPLSAEHKQKNVWRSRIMEKNHYGLVNVRTDGETIFCATKDETAEDWILHTFPARFAAA